jgi:hypothetical protein
MGTSSAYRPAEKNINAISSDSPSKMPLQHIDIRIRLPQMSANKLLNGEPHRVVKAQRLTLRKPRY